METPTLDIGSGEENGMYGMEESTRTSWTSWSACYTASSLLLGHYVYNFWVEGIFDDYQAKREEKAKQPKFRSREIWMSGLDVR